MYQDKTVSSGSSDSGYDSLEGSIDARNNRGKLTIFTLGDSDYLLLMRVCIYFNFCQVKSIVGLLGRKSWLSLQKVS